MRITTVTTLSLIALVLTTSCSVMEGSSGKIYGEYDRASGSTISNFIMGGFPTGMISSNKQYEIKPGSYYVRYTILWGGYYYPGNSSGTGSLTNSSLYWYATYEVTANKGKIPFQNGDDKYFKLYLNRNRGLEVVSGDVTLRSAFEADDSTRPHDRRQAWTTADGAYTITITNSGIGSD